MTSWPAQICSVAARCLISILEFPTVNENDEDVEDDSDDDDEDDNDARQIQITVRRSHEKKLLFGQMSDGSSAAYLHSMARGARLMMALHCRARNGPLQSSRKHEKTLKKT